MADRFCLLPHAHKQAFQKTKGGKTYKVSPPSYQPRCGLYCNAELAAVGAPPESE